MCHFITATLPAGLSSEAVETIARNHGRNWLSASNKYVARHLDDGEQYFYTTRGHCDCGTSLGSSRAGDKDESKLAKQLKKLRRKGWSEAKIDRWLKDKEKARSNRPEPENDAAIWVALIDNVLGSTDAKYVGLLLHFYSGDLNDEQIAISHVETVPRSELTEDRLRAIHEDVLYRFHA